MSELDSINAEMDASNLYSEEILTDRKMGTIRILTPVLADGRADPSRKPIFSGEIQIMTQMGPLPINFDIEADTVEEAVKKYGESAKAGVQKTLDKIQELRREAATKIVTPGTPGFGVPPAAGGSSIQMP
ncbi:MAG TPA: hypothetical protein DD376_00310 [Sutterella sp.]|nr:hypothetical protein [Sutterella sp.]